MSDRAATELKFNELSESYRSDILPKMVTDWDQLPEDDKTILSRLNNFFCGLHSLVHIAEVINKSLVDIEKNNFNEEVLVFNKKFNKTSESAVVRLIRTCCKAFSLGGDAKKMDAMVHL